MSKDSKIVFIILVAIAIDRACTLLPSGVYFDPFPLYDLMYNGENVGINLQSYCKAITTHLALIGLLFAFRMALSHMSKLFKYMIIIECLSLADFFIIYEQSLFSLGFYKVEFTDFRILGHATFMLLWKSGKL